MLNKFSLTIVCFISIGSVALADTVALNPDHPDSYVVEKGDTLWDISGRFLQQPWRWKEIWQVNPQIENPDLIFPGDIITLTYEDGQPVLTVDRGGRVVSGRDIKLSPTVRSYEKEDAVHTIPIDVIRQFLTRPMIVSEKEMEVWPYVVSSYEQHLIAGTGNKIYIRGLDEDSSTKRYAMYRRGQALINTLKDESDILGYEAIYVGDAVIEQLGDPATAIVTQARREVMSGDRLTEETEADVNTNFTPRSPDHQVQGNVISAIDVVSEIGQYQIVVVDIGEVDGMEVGNVLGVFQSGVIVKDKVATEIKARKKCEERIVFENEEGATNEIVSNLVNDIKDTKCAFDKTDLVGYLGRPNTKPEVIELPPEYAGVLLVFRIFDRVSYALVMEAESPIHVNDTVRNL